MPVLPLFPLGTVLFPGGTLPLQVFEPRYLQLLQDVHKLPEPQRQFGVVAIRSGHEVGAGAARELYDVGTSARIEAMGRDPSGAPVLHLLTTGTRRFRLDGVDDDAQTPYLRAWITWVDGPTGRADGELANVLLDEVTAYRAVLGAPAPELAHAAPGELAFLAMDTVRLDLGDRQRILDAPDVASRLRIGLALVRRERALVERLGSLPQPPDLGGMGLN